MNVQLVRIGLDEAEDLWKLQTRAFMDLYERYQDTETSPATEKLEKIIMRLNQSFTYYYYIEVDGQNVGAIRVVDLAEEGKAKRISPIFIMPEYRNKGFAQKAILLAEEIHGCSNWELENCFRIWSRGSCYSDSIKPSIGPQSD